MQKIKKSRGIIKDVLCCDKLERVKRKAVTWKKESVAGRKDFIDNEKIPSQEVLDSVHVNLIPCCEG